LVWFDNSILDRGRGIGTITSSSRQLNRRPTFIVAMGTPGDFATVHRKRDLLGVSNSLNACQGVEQGPFM
jgi:hypothetical protein